MFLRPATETDWLTEVLGVMRRLGWTPVHFHDSRRQRGGEMWGDTDAKGWPDIFAVRGQRLLAAELKSDDPARKVSPDQWAWLKLLEASGAVETFVWRPCQAEQALAVLGAKGDPPLRSNLDSVSPGTGWKSRRKAPSLF